MEVMIENRLDEMRICIGTTADNSWGGYLDHEDVEVMYGRTSMRVDLKHLGLSVTLPRSFGTDKEWKDAKWVTETVWISLRSYLDGKQFA